MSKKIVYKPKKGGFNLDERKQLKPYGSDSNKKKENNKNGR